MGNPVPSDPAEATLAEYRDRALRATDVSFVITDATRPGGPIVWVNEAFTRTTGYTLAEVVGRNPNLLHGPGTDPTVTAGLAQAVRERRPATVTVLNYRRDGVPFWNQVSLSTVHDEHGTVTHWVGIQVDVTEQVRRAEEQDRSIAAERRARTGLALVSRVSDILADLDNPDVLTEIAALLRAEVVPWAEFFLADGALQPASGIEAGGSHALRRPRRPGSGEPGGAPTSDPVQELLDGQRQGPLELSIGAVEDGSVGPTTLWLVQYLRSAGGDRALQPDAVVVVDPILGRRTNVGVLVTTPRSGVGLGGMEAGDRTVLTLVARRVGMAVENVRLYVREHRLAETLQRAMLPEQAEVRGLDVWTYYAPSSGHAQVGGDWYDVVQVSAELVTVVIGDVVGHDVEAAAAMGQLRSVVRSYGFDGAAPGPVLDRVDQLIAGMRMQRSASLVFATLTQSGDGWTLRYSRAGHLPPLVSRRGEVVQLRDAGGPMIGFGTGSRDTATIELEPGDVVVLYTDGLIERRDRTLREGLDALVEVASGLGTLDAAGAGEELLSRLAGEPEDDVAVVVVRVPGPRQSLEASTSTPRARRWSLPSEAASIGRARQAVSRTCQAWDIGSIPAAELVVSELVANAVLHGWGHVVLRLFDTGEGLRIEVEDFNPAPPVTTDGHPGRVGGYGMRIVERLADWGWRTSGPGKLVWARVRPMPPGGGLLALASSPEGVAAGRSDAAPTPEA